ncbi:MAG: hypothetical protein N2517_03710 [Ignavibacteria bacterium]|nr:hypothetical protein [Ignavibacteria bacterium]
MIIFNYAVRLLTILFGVFLASGKFLYEHPYKLELQIIGVLLIIWGVYRIYSYRKALKQLKEDEAE